MSRATRLSSTDHEFVSVRPAPRSPWNPALPVVLRLKSGHECVCGDTIADKGSTQMWYPLCNFVITIPGSGRRLGSSGHRRSHHAGRAEHSRCLSLHWVGAASHIACSATADGRSGDTRSRDCRPRATLRCRPSNYPGSARTPAGARDCGSRGHRHQARGGRSCHDGRLRAAATCRTGASRRGFTGGRLECHDLDHHHHHRPARSSS